MESPVKQLRQRLGLSQDDFSQQVGVSQSYLSNVERGIAPVKGKLRRYLEEVAEDASDVAEKQEEFIEAHKAETFQKVASSFTASSKDAQTR